MSLLLDALKRAEDAKRAKAEAASGAAAPLSNPSAALDGEPTADAVPGATSGRPTPIAPIAGATDAADAESRDIVDKSPLPDFPMLTLEQIDTQPPDPVAQSNMNPAVVTPARATAMAGRSATQAAPITGRDTSQNNHVADATAPNTDRSIGLSTNEFVLAELLKSTLSPDTPAANVASAQTPSSATAAFRAARSTAIQPADAVSAKSTSAMSLEDDGHFPDAAAVATQTAQREAVKNVFAVKKSAQQGGNKAAWAIPVIAISIAGVGVGGWYVWREINKISRPTMAKVSGNSPMPAPKLPTATPAIAAGASAAVPANAATLVDATKAAPALNDATAAEIPPPLPPLLPPPAEALPVTKLTGKTGTGGSSAIFTLRETLARRIEALPVPQNPATNAVTLRPATKSATLAISPALAAGYAALSSGDFALAKRHYAEAIAADGNNTDANLGFATAAARTGELAMAERYYRRVLEIDPRNVTAATSLLTLAVNNDALPPATNLEGELLRLIALDPTVPASHFALGNFYAAQRRWSEAQPSFFEAVRLTPQNPDYAYNLAVSLDQLGQTKTAVDFYRRALAAKGQAQFDRTAVERRLVVLAPQRANQ